MLILECDASQSKANCNSILPALAFSFDMFNRTDNSFGVNEVLLASVIGCCMFATMSCQPLVIVGITGPISVYAYTTYNLVDGQNYFVFWAWIGIWSMVLHWLLAIFNANNLLVYVTRFSCDTFGLYVAFIYLQKGVEVLLLQWEGQPADSPQPYLSVMVALLVTIVALTCLSIGESTLLHRTLRKIIEDYGTPLTIIFFSGFVHIGYMGSVSLQTLPTSTSFQPTADRGWLVPFWEVSAREVFLALPFAIILTILFYFDHNGECYRIAACFLLIILVSSLIGQGSEFPLRKPPGFHWDFFLLGILMGVCGILGLPFPNGLIPQAPFHTKSLAITHSEVNEKGQAVLITDEIVEQRVSHLSQGLLFLVTMTEPLLIVLSQIPQAVLAGLFFVMGLQALMVNGVVLKLKFLFQDRALADPSDPLLQIRRKWVLYSFVAFEVVIFIATFAITQTPGAIVFPVFIALMIPARSALMPRYYERQEMELLDTPTAGENVMDSIRGDKLPL